LSARRPQRTQAIQPRGSVRLLRAEGVLVWPPMRAFFAQKVTH